MLLAGCAIDTVSHTYANMAAARADALFDKGWLPDVLPSSATNIETFNQLDLNYSTGSFEFTSSEAAAFYARLTPGESPLPFQDWPSTIEEFKGKRFSAWSYHSPDATWVFFCSPQNDRCEYFMK